MNKKKNSNKQSNRRRNGPQGVSSIPRDYMHNTVAGVAPHVRRTLSWSTQAGGNLTPGGVFNNPMQIILNSPYDPDFALGGLSSAGFAKYMALYSKCFALSARARINFACSGTGVSGACPATTLIGTTITTYTTSLGTAVAAINAGLCSYKLINQNPDSGVLTTAVDFAKFVDKPDILDDPEFYCTATAGPTQVICLHLWAVVPGALPVVNLNYVINVDIDCIFTDPIPFT